MQNKPADPQIGNVDNKTTAPGGTTPVSGSSTKPMKQQSTAAKTARTASETASSLKNKAADVAGSAASAARSRAASLGEEVEQRAESAIDGVISNVNERVEAGKGQASGYVSSFGRALQAASQSLEDDGLTLPAGYVRAAANGLDQAANEVDGFDTGSITSNVEYYVRGNPMLAVASMTLVGFALTRLIGSGRRR